MVSLFSNAEINKFMLSIFRPDGRRYEGGWLDGKQHGKSTYINAKGVVKVGIWEHGKRIEWVDSGADANQ